MAGKKSLSPLREYRDQYGNGVYVNIHYIAQIEEAGNGFAKVWLVNRTEAIYLGNGVKEIVQDVKNWHSEQEFL